MSFKIVSLLVVGVVLVTAVISAARKTGISRKSKQTLMSAEGPVELNSAAPDAVSFVPMAVDEKALPTDEDVLIPVNKADAAPAFSDGNWINSEPLTIEKLRGRVVLVDFWTFGCFNCINTLPALKSFNSKYSEKGLTIIGVETPETNREKVFDNLVKAVGERGIKYPIVTDYRSKTWSSYNVEAWPTVIILDKRGRIRYRHVGEGAYDAQENVIRTLLAE